MPQNSPVFPSLPMQAPDSAPAQAAADICRKVRWSGPLAVQNRMAAEAEECAGDRMFAGLMIDEFVVAGSWSVLHGTRSPVVASKDNQ